MERGKRKLSLHGGGKLCLSQMGSSFHQKRLSAVVWTIFRVQDWSKQQPERHREVPSIGRVGTQRVHDTHHSVTAGTCCWSPKFNTQYCHLSFPSSGKGVKGQDFAHLLLFFPNPIPSPWNMGDYLLAQLCLEELISPLTVLRSLLRIKFTFCTT